MARKHRAVGRDVLSAWGPVVLYMAAIFVLSGLPRIPVPPGVIFTWDKVQHVIAYFGLGLVSYRAAVLKPIAGSAGPYVQALLVSAIYGALDEYHQSFVPGRTMSGLDWLADFAGVLICLAVVAIVKNRRGNGGKQHVGRGSGI